MFGLPNHHTLSKAVRELTMDHEHTAEGVTGTEEGLLLMLERAIASDTSGAHGGGGGKGAILNAAALDLWEEIRRGLPYAGKVYPPRRLEMLACRVAGDEAAEEELLGLCRYWSSRIRELLAPPRRVPVKGQHCPACGYAQVTLDMDGEDVLQPCLVATLTGADSRLECLACTASWRADTWERVFGASGLPGGLQV